MERTRLELLFDQELLQNAEQARILCGSPVTRFVRSVQSAGGVSAVRELCRRNRPSDAFDSLAQAGRLDLSAEASAVKGKYGPLFTDEDDAAQRLLYNNCPIETFGRITAYVTVTTIVIHCFTEIVQ